MAENNLKFIFTKGEQIVSTEKHRDKNVKPALEETNPSNEET